MALDAFSVKYAPWEQVTFQDALDVVTREPAALFSLSSIWLQNKELVLAALSRNGSLLGDYRLTVWCQNDEEVVLAALKQNGLALEHVSMRLKHKESVLKTALSQNGLALAYAPKTLRSCQGLVRIAVQQNSQAIHFSRSSNERL